MAHMGDRQTNDGKPQQELLVGQYYKHNTFISNAMVAPSMVNQISQIPFPFQLVQTSPTLGRHGETKFNLLQMGNRSQLMELSNGKNQTYQNVVMASDSNQIMLQTKQTPVRSNTHQILKAVNKGNQTSQLVKCVTTTASSIQPQQKIIMMNGINNNQTTVIRKGINDRNDSNQSQNTVIHSRPTMTTSIANGQAIDVSYLRQNVIQNPIQMKGGQRTVIGQMPMQTINANPPIVYYPTNFGQGTFHATSGQLQTATSQQIRDAVNNNQSNISHHHNLQKALPNGCQFVQLIPNTAMISQASAMNNAQHTTQLITTQAPMNSDVVTLQKTERPAILKRQRPQVNTTERRATFGNNHVSCPKIPKVDVEPVHIKVATGASQVTPSSLPVAMMPSSSTPSTDHSAGTAIGTSAPISSNKRNISNSTSVTPNSNSGFAITSTNVPKLNELSSSNDGSAAKLEKSVLSTGTINNPSLIRQQTVIRSPRKPRKQTLIRTEQTNAGQSRLSDPIIGQKKLMDEVSTDEADEFEDENPASENRAENRLKLEIHRDTGSTRQYKFPTKRSNNRGNNQIILSPGTPSLSEKLSNPFGPNNSEKVIMSSTSLTPIMSPKLDSGNHNKSCVRLRIFGGQNAQSSSKKERDNLRHFAKHSDVKMAAVENLTLTQLRFLTKSTSSKVDAVNQAIRHMQKDESSIYSILEDLKSKMEYDHLLHELMQSNLQRAKEGVHQLNESHAAACRLLSHYFKVEKPDKKDVPLLKKLLKKAKQKF